MKIAPGCGSDALANQRPNNSALRLNFAIPSKVGACAPNRLNMLVASHAWGSPIMAAPTHTANAASPPRKNQTPTESAAIKTLVNTRTLASGEPALFACTRPLALPHFRVLKRAQVYSNCLSASTKQNANFYWIRFKIPSSTSRSLY